MEVRDTLFSRFYSVSRQVFGKFELFYVATHTFGHKTVCRDEINSYI